MKIDKIKEMQVFIDHLSAFNLDKVEALMLLENCSFDLETYEITKIGIGKYYESVEDFRIYNRSFFLNEIEETEARELFGAEKEVFELHDDGSESLIRSLEHFENANAYGVEIKFETERRFDDDHGFSLIKELISRGYTVKVVFADVAHVSFETGVISCDDGYWTIAGEFRGHGEPVKAERSLENLMNMLSMDGWNSFKLCETIEAIAEDDLTCRCGNTVDSEGFYPCDEQGNEVVPLPSWGDLIICGRCGLICDEKTYNCEDQTMDIVAFGEFKPLPDFKVGNSVGYLKGYVDTDEYHIVNSLDQISAFVMKFASESETTIVTMLDTPVLTTMGGFINKCPDKEFLDELKAVLIPMQMGEIEPSLFMPTPYDVD